jgi:glucosyl-3-phosphoglycerate synthase
MYGRVVRLFLWPFLDALALTLPRRSPLVAFLRSFRYPLSGEMAITADLARNIRVPTDWGLEMGILGEVYRNAAPKRVCQVDLGFHHHKHNPVGEAAGEGLQRMALDVAATIYRLLAGTEGAQVSREMLTTLQVTYRREAQDAIRKYHMDSLANGLRYDRHEEEMVVERIEPLVKAAGLHFMEHPTKDLIGEWLRALAADPEAPQRIRGSTGIPLRERDALVEAARAESR